MVKHRHSFGMACGLRRAACDREGASLLPRARRIDAPTLTLPRRPGEGILLFLSGADRRPQTLCFLIPAPTLALTRRPGEGILFLFLLAADRGPQTFFFPFLSGPGPQTADRRPREALP
jgi:hypothetical protein